MPRHTSHRAHDDHEFKLNLAPIMNLVMILIPLLLLSVVFEQTGVININAPKMICCQTTEPQAEPLHLTIHVSRQGFTLNTHLQGRLAPVGACPSDSPATICARGGGAEVGGLLTEMRRLRERYDATGDDTLRAASDEHLNALRERYNFRGLYNALVQLKRQHPDETRVSVSASPDIPFELLIATMDTARHRLESARDDEQQPDDEAFARAPYVKDGGGHAPLFSNVSLTVAPEH